MEAVNHPTTQEGLRTALRGFRRSNPYPRPSFAFKTLLVAFLVVHGSAWCKEDVSKGQDVLIEVQTQTQTPVQVPVHECGSHKGEPAGCAVGETSEIEKMKGIEDGGIDAKTIAWDDWILQNGTQK